MKKLLFFILFSFSTMLSAQDVVGFWKTIDDVTDKVQSVIAIYEYQNKYYGRLIATYDADGNIQDSIMSPEIRAEGVKGNPYISGLDLIWDLKKGSSKYTDGKIMDPEHGRIYDAEIWRENNDLIVRGEIKIFGKGIGRNQKWPEMTDAEFPVGFKKPDLSKMKPVIPEVNSH